MFILAISCITALLMPNILTYGASLEERYALYKDGTATGGEFLTIFYTILPIIFLFWKKYIPQNRQKYYDVYLQMLICGSLIYLVVTLTASYVELTRFAAYFQISSVFLWAEIFGNKKSIPNTITKIGFLLCHIVFFIIYLSKMANLTPYTFNKILF